MKDLVKPAVVLFIIAAIAAALLGFVNVQTAPAIAKAEADSKAENMAKVFAKVGDKEYAAEDLTFDDSVELEVDDNNHITDYSKATDADGNELGYAFAVTTKGYGSGLKLMIGVDMEGTVTGLSIVDCSNETPGLGANASNDKYFGEGKGWYSQFEGKTNGIEVKKSGETVGDNDIQAITGATITSKAVTGGVNEALQYFNDNLKGGSN
jgi:electron transport complex protein RnfG